LSAEDAERLARLDHDKTFVVTSQEISQSLRPLQERGVNICPSDLHLRHTMTRCTKPFDIACVAPNGHMYSCGLVLGDREFAFGDAREHRLDQVMNDQSLPHAIEDMSRHHGDGCSGCPSLVAAHLDAIDH
jgi:radical SAM protein with 4Fe4S-binding SPASM domain